MPSAVSPDPTDMATAGSTFSYAQAAKGRSSSHSASLGSSKSHSDESENATKVEHSNGKAVEPAHPAASADEPADANADHTAASQPEATGRTVDADTVPSTTKENDEDAQSKPNVPEVSVAVGPEASQTNGVGAASQSGSGDATPSAKDEDTSAAANDSESTWEKISQESQNDEKVAHKSEGGDEDSKLTSWEHVSPQPAPLKEAPPPSVNIWQKRMATQNKVKDTRPPQTQENAIESNQRSTSLISDPVKAESRKRSITERNSKEEKGATGESSASEVKGRSNDEVSTRGTRSASFVKPVTAPPPASDATSWPTPNLAKDDEKKKSQDRSEKVETEKATGKPHGKEKWVTMPYVPNAVFATPLPTNTRRGGRPRGGREERGRGGGHMVNGSINGERNGSGSAASPSTTAPTSSERTRGEMGPPKPGQYPPKSKRASSAGPSSSREPRRNGDVVVDGGVPKSLPRNTGLDSRRVSSSTQTDGARQGSPPSRRQQDYNKDERSQSVFSGRRDGSWRSGENTREPGTLPQGRERGEGRPERGRGGYRGPRGGHNGFGAHGFNGQPPAPGYAGAPMPQGYPPKSQSYSEQRYASQPQTPSFGPPREGKHYRNNSRSQSIPNAQAYGRYPPNGPMPGPQGLPHLQTDAANMYYSPPGVMSAMPFNTVMEQAQLSSMIQIQMEYYFSLENLVRDTFLRKHMDSQGFVLLNVLLSFNRIKQLTEDAELVRAACWRSPFIEFQQGVDDGLDRVRPIRDWKQWVLPMQDRLPEAQQDGPSQVQTPHLQYAPNGMFPGPMGPMVPMSPATYGSPQYGPEHGAANGSHPMPPRHGDGSITQTPLSAAVPDFTPSMPQTLPHPSHSPTHHADSTFPDEQIGSLTIVVNRERNETSTVKPPPAATRTFSNGSIDPESIADEVSGLGLADVSTGVATNGDQAPESRSQDVSSRPRDPLARLKPYRQPSGDAPPPVFWVKGKESPIEGLPANLVAESYVAFREQALARRQNASPDQSNYDMAILYQFWSHFLVRNFNTSMYEEFRRFALEDDQAGATAVGVENLVTFYDASILGHKVISDNLAYDFVDMAKSDHESGKKERPAFQKLRSALRNGALPLRNRVKVDKLLSPELRAELDR